MENQNRLLSPMSEGGEQENQRAQNRLLSPMSEGGEQENQRA